MARLWASHRRVSLFFTPDNDRLICGEQIAGAVKNWCLRTSHLARISCFSRRDPAFLDRMGCSDWFEDWLAGRSQRVRGGLTTAPVTHGIIQGSLLGTILFLLFTNDLPSYIDDCKIVMYADDTQFIHCCDMVDLPELQSRVETSLKVASAGLQIMACA